MRIQWNRHQSPFKIPSQHRPVLLRFPAPLSSILDALLLLEIMSSSSSASKHKLNEDEEQADEEEETTKKQKTLKTKGTSPGEPTFELGK